MSATEIPSGQTSLSSSDLFHLNDYGAMRLVRRTLVYHSMMRGKSGRGMVKAIFRGVVPRQLPLLASPRLGTKHKAGLTEQIQHQRQKNDSFDFAHLCAPKAPSMWPLIRLSFGTDVVNGNEECFQMRG